MSLVKLGLIQAACSGDKEANLKAALQEIKSLASRGAQIICLQELFSTLYFCQSEDHSQFSLAEAPDGPTIQAMQSAAKENDVVIIVPYFEKRTEGLYHNSAVVIDADGTVLGNYRKMHIPDDPNFYEKFYFTPGDLGFRVFKTKYARVAVLICWDQWFPEAARLTALQGAQILFYPTAIGWHENDAAVADDQRQAWQTIQRSHSIANEVFVASVNRVGKEGDLTFWGHSFVSDPFGKILSEASGDKPETMIVDCELDAIEQTRQGWPFLRDRRIDAYDPITRRFLDS